MTFTESILEARKRIVSALPITQLLVPSKEDDKTVFQEAHATLAARNVSTKPLRGHVRDVHAQFQNGAR